MNGRSRVLVQEQGHLYNDSGDCLQRLSGINAVPLGQGRATFSLEEVVAAVDAASSGRVSTGIGAIAIETPVRRRHGELFDRSAMREICAYGRRNGIGLHLDGARLYLASAFTGVRPAEYAADFDTVYVSLYKYFRSPAGAILAGPAHLLDDLYHERRMFGGSLNQAWVFAAVALKHLAGFEQRFAEVVQAAARLKSGLASVSGLTVREVPNGTNIFQLNLDRIDQAELIKARLETNGVLLPAPEGSSFYLKLNESLLSLRVDRIVDLFAEACA